MKKITNLIIAMIISVLTACGSSPEVDIASINTGVDPNTWVLVPAGEFLKGQHSHETMVDYDFEIMVTDVTNDQYAKYLNKALEKGTIKIIENKVMGYYPGDPFQGYKHEFEIRAGDKLHVPLEEAGIHISFDGKHFNVEKGYENHPVVMITRLMPIFMAGGYPPRLNGKKRLVVLMPGPIRGVIKFPVIRPIITTAVMNLKRNLENRVAQRL